MHNPRHDEIQYFLAWRRQTRFIRHYGGPILALGLFVTCLWFVWQAFESRSPVYRTQMESRESVEKARQQQRAEERQRQAEAWKQPVAGQQATDRTLQASKFPRR